MASKPLQNGFGSLAKSHTKYILNVLGCHFISLHYPFNIATVCIDISSGDLLRKSQAATKYMNIMYYERVRLFFFSLSSFLGSIL